MISNCSNKFVGSKKRGLDKIVSYIMFLLLIIVFIPMSVSAADASDFNISITNCDISDNVLTIGFDVIAPSTEVDGTIYAVDLVFKANGLDLVQPGEKYPSVFLNESRFSIVWPSSNRYARLVYGHKNISDIYSGGTKSYQILFDVSTLELNNDVIVEIYPGRTDGGMATWGGTGVQPATSGTALDSYTIKKDNDIGSNISYIASFGTPSVTTIEPTSELPFTVPVVMTSESALSGAELNLSCNPEVAKITGVTLNISPDSSQNTIAADGGSAKISFYGNEQSAKDGLTVATVTMQPVAEGTSSLSITKGTAALAGTTLEYPVTVPDSSVTVEVKKQDTMDTQTFVSAVQGGITLVTYTPGTAVAEGMVPAYDGKPMFKGADGSYLCLVKGTADSSKIGTISGTAAEVTHPQKGATDAAPADLNDSGSVNIVDAQIAYDLATGQYTEIADQLTGTTVDMLHWLKADVNGSGSVDASDPRSIQSFIHTNEWFKDAAA